MLSAVASYFARIFGRQTLIYSNSLTNRGSMPVNPPSCPFVEVILPTKMATVLIAKRAFLLLRLSIDLV